MSADSLSATARAFYEQTRFKMVASIFLASMAMMALAYCSTYGGQSNSAASLRKAVDDDKMEDSQQALVGGYGNKNQIVVNHDQQLQRAHDFIISPGFGSFMFFVAFSVFLTGSIYISPMFCGTNSEKKMISKPQEVDEGLFL